MIEHNIGFYEDLTKIIFELSSNIIKYAPYFSVFHNLVVVGTMGCYSLTMYWATACETLTLNVEIIIIIIFIICLG